MITYDQLTQIGALGRTHGTGGELLLLTRHDYDEFAPTFLVLLIDNLFVPFRLLRIRQRNNTEYIVSLLGIDSEQSASHLSGRQAYILRSESGDNDDEDIADISGYELYNGEQLVGTIDYLDDSTVNALFVLRDGTLIPAHEDLITDIDHIHRRIVCHLPEGLVEK